MTKKEIYSNFSKEVAVKEIESFLESLSKMYVFDKVNFIWEGSKFSITYVLRKRTETDVIEILVSRKKKTKVLIQGEKNFSVAYFFLELNKILKML